MHAMYGKGMAGLGSVDFLSLPIVASPARSAFYLGFLALSSWPASTLHAG